AQPRHKPRSRGGRVKRRRAGGKGPEEAKPPKAANGPAGITRPRAAPADGDTGSRAAPLRSDPAAAAKGERRSPGFPAGPCKLVAIDCEMVGTGPGGRTSDLARCSIVGYDGD
ncbi:AEN nuclease, partial [Alcedo cyanopectus]|nr:AEN nuclease [Ceyx cyanopectus]